MTTVRTLARISRLLENSSGELSMPQYRLLAMVAEGDERASNLAGRLALAKPTITAAVDGLVERGMVDRVVLLSSGDYEVHMIAVNWPHHVFVNTQFQVVGAD